MEKQKADRKRPASQSNTAKINIQECMLYQVTQQSTKSLLVFVSNAPKKNTDGLETLGIPYHFVRGVKDDPARINFN